jgi:uncharacterized membrane protein
MNTAIQIPQASEEALLIFRLLQLIEGANKDIEIGKNSKDTFMVRQYEHLKSKYVKELIELLSRYQLTVQIKEAEVKEAA